MPDPFYSVHCVAKVDENFHTCREVYLLGPQFCGGEKQLIARVYPETVLDAKVSDAELRGVPEEVMNFLRWSEENVVCPKLSV